jgi:SAM-dependent methyltransferase
VSACDLDADNVAVARRVYGERFRVTQGSALELPAEAGEVDVVVLFEALYYLPDAARFLSECRRVLSADGRLLLSTTNPDLFDFSPSPLSHRYYGARELGPLLAAQGFRTSLFGYDRAEGLPLRHRLLRPVKATLGTLGLLPKTMRGKARLRRLLFGPLPVMPADLTEAPIHEAPLEPVASDAPDRVHRFLYVVGEREQA